MKKLIAPIKSTAAPWPLRAACLAGLLFALSSPVVAQTNLLKIDYEWADTVSGPWSKPPLNQTYVQPDGSLLTLSTTGQKLFRLNIEGIEFDDIQSPSVPVAKLRPSTVSIAESHLKWLSSNLLADGSEDPESMSWAGAKLAPVAVKLFDPSYKEGTEPAYIEFKVIAEIHPPDPIRFLANKNDPAACNLGYILVSLHEGDAPVAQFSQEGATPCEELLGRAGAISNVKIMRYGPTYSAVENERGELIANIGTDPYRLPDNLFDYDQTFMGTFDSELVSEPPKDGYGGPKLKAAPYESYEGFKSDYINSPIYQEFRRRQAIAVAPDWIVENGGMLPLPPVFSVKVGEWIHAFESQTVTRYFLDDDEPAAIPLATIDDNTGGDGLAIRGERVGSARFTVEIGGRVTHYELRVTQAGVPAADEPEFAPAGTGFTPGWQPYQTWLAGGWSEQPRYWQTLDYDRWCPYVGCGPVAWAILFGWWDRHGVPACFYSNLAGDLTAQDAPFRLTDNTGKMRSVYRSLHDYCDVICWGLLSDQGTTLPGDMVEGGPSYLWIPKTLGRLEYKYVWAYNTADPDWSQASSRIRYANKSGRPAIAGWYWHYAVSYAYTERVFKLTSNGPVIWRQRYFKCNMGSPNEVASWRNGSDMIFGAYIIPTQK
jgi:hypothetical protein